MIEGKLVNLRTLRLDDLETCQRWINDPEVTRYLSARYQMSLAAEEAWLRSIVEAPMSFSHGTIFGIETKDGRHIGNVNLFDATPENRAAELGVMIGEKDCWSQGYGGDAIATLLRVGFDDMNLRRVQLNVFDFNPRAQACYRRCGFVEEGRLRSHYYGEGGYHDVIVMGVLRDEFYALHGRSEEDGR